MINSNDLVMKEQYFLVTFFDRRLKLPRIRTVVYIGKNIFKEEVKDKWYFQDAELYLSEGIPKELSDAEDLGVLALGEDALPLVETLDSLIEILGDVKEDKLRFKHKV